MNVPALKGIIDRRILVNYRVDPRVLSQLLPAPFRPQIVGGFGIAGICLIRLKALRPNWLPSVPGWSSENAAHRIAVEWTVDGKIRHGVYVPRRDTNSRMAVLVGGRLFPGVQHHARFRVDERGDRFRIAMESGDGQVNLAVDCHLAGELPPGSIFASIAQASEFFKAGSIGFSDTHQHGQFDGLELHCRDWKVEPLQVESLRSNYFDDLTRFPAGSTRLDCALLMRGIHHEWHGEPRLCCTSAVCSK